MNVTFTGYKNAMASTITTIMPDTNKKFVTHAISCKLTNDHYGQDLTNYVKALEKSEGKRHPYDASYINIITQYGDEFNSPKIYLNGEELDVNDKNLGIFSFCAKFLKNVMPKIKNQLTDGYFKSDDFNKHIFIGPNLKEVLPQNEYNNLAPNLVKDEIIQNHAKTIFDNIQTVMEDYFA